MAVFRNREEDSELRIAAYLATDDQIRLLSTAAPVFSFSRKKDAS
jgi:hypothetical protein